MGLDIYCNKLVKTAKTPYDKEHRIRCIFDVETKRYVDWDFPEWARAYKKSVTEKWYDWNKYKEQTGIDIDQYNIFSQEYSANGNFLQIYPKDKEEQLNEIHKNLTTRGEELRKLLDEIIVTINLKDVPLVKVKTNCIYYKEVGYQRKGLNNQFYKDYEDGKIGYYVWTLAELERYKKDYCDTEEAKQNFQTNIIDNFKEGKCVVEFSW